MKAPFYRYKNYAIIPNDARRVRWKCDKCSDAFEGYKFLHEHKQKVHAY